MTDLTLKGGSDDGEIPSWLSTAPSADMAPPVATRQQTLPLNGLRWEDFERLCLRLALLEAESNTAGSTAPADRSSMASTYTAK